MKGSKPLLSTESGVAHGGDGSRVTILPSLHICLKYSMMLKQQQQNHTHIHNNNSIFQSLVRDEMAKKKSILTSPTHS